MTIRPGPGPALRTALDCLVEASVATRSDKLDTDELTRGLRALMLALVAHGALKQSRGKASNTAATWLCEVEKRSNSDRWSTLLELLERESHGLPAPLQALLDPVPLRKQLRRKAVQLDDRSLPKFLELLQLAANHSSAEGFSLISQLEVLGAIHELFLDLQLARGSARTDLTLATNLSRRRSGSHFTPGALCHWVTERTLQPLLRRKGSQALLALRVCDPAMGTGAFLIHSCELLAQAVLAAWKREKHPQLKGLDDAQALQLARRAVIERCLYGVDRDREAVVLARASLSLYGNFSGLPTLDLAKTLRHGDALVGQPCVTSNRSQRDSFPHAFDWPVQFSDVFSESVAGFDAMVGNPPWVAYVGRAAQPLDPKLARYYVANNSAFRGYRTLHGLFIQRAAQLLKPAGRLGLVIPTSVADLAGYEPTRISLDALCAVDDPLPDFGDGRFPGVFQPCIGLLATRREAVVQGRGVPWTLLRDDLDPEAAALLQRLATLPLLPSELFGERGFQTTGTDRALLRQQSEPRGEFTLPLRQGIDVREFIAAKPAVFAPPRALRGRLRPSADWQAVSVLIRQTARYPIAALADGTPFRNSILAGFSNKQYSPQFLMCYLNSNVIRWFHFMTHRDARQGMPQLKIGHLRRLPAPQSAAAIKQLHALGSKLAGRRAPSTDERDLLNTWASKALGLSDPERDLVTRWAVANPLPRPRKTTRDTEHNANEATP